MPQSCDEHEGRKRQGLYQMVAVSADRLRLGAAALSQREIFSPYGSRARPYFVPPFEKSIQLWA